MNRKEFLTQSTLAGIGYLTLPRWVPNIGGDYPPVRAITGTPGHHWFGYYDKEQVDPSGRYALGMEVDINMRLPQSTDVLDIGMIDLESKARWKKIELLKAHS